MATTTTTATTTIDPHYIVDCVLAISVPADGVPIALRRFTALPLVETPRDGCRVDQPVINTVRSPLCHARHVLKRDACFLYRRKRTPRIGA